MQTLKLTKKYEKYPEYKDSGVEWLRKIPTNWESNQLKRLFDFQSGDGFPDNFQGGQTGTIPFMKVSDINGIDRYVTSANNYVDLETVKEKSWHLIPAGSILMAKIGAALGKNHRKVNVIPICIDNNMLAVTPKKVSAEYGFWIWKMLNLSDFENISSVPSVNLDLLRNYSFPVPDIKQQIKLAKYLDSKTSSIDQIIEKKEKQIMLLREKRTAQIKNIIKSFDIEGKEYTKEKIKHVIKSIESGIWGENPLGNIDDIKCLRVADFDYSNLSFSDVETIRNNKKLSTRKILQYGDILVEKSGGGEKTPVGRAILFNSNERMVCANFVDVVRANRSKILPDFLVLFLSVLYSERINTRYIKQNTGIQNMDIKAYFGEIVSFPDLKAQKDIVDNIQKKMALFDQAIKKVEKTIDFLKEFKSSLISNAVTGKIKV